MPSNPNRVIDKTHLSIDTAEERVLVHRDYIAHCFRWSHVVRHLNKTYADAIVLDVGCGKELPLAKLLYSNRMIPLKYTGVDANKLEIPEMLKGKKIPVEVWEQTDFCSLKPEDVSLELDQEDGSDLLVTNDGVDILSGKYFKRPNIVTCFEVLEHVTPDHTKRMVEHVAAVMAKDGTFFVSTPCYNGSAAGNHINEMTYHAVGSLLTAAGFRIKGHWGTFASITDYRDRLEAAGLGQTFAELRTYYDSNVLAIIFAPLFPDASRNVLWECTLEPQEDWQVAKFTWEGTVEPWSQHKDWRELETVVQRDQV